MDGASAYCVDDEVAAASGIPALPKLGVPFVVYADILGSSRDGSSVDLDRSKYGLRVGKGLAYGGCQILLTRPCRHLSSFLLTIVGRKTSVVLVAVLICDNQKKFCFLVRVKRGKCRL